MTAAAPVPARTAVRDPVAEYHALLTDGDAGNVLAADSHEQLERQLEGRGLFFGDRPLCTVLRPRFMRAAQYAALQERARLVLRAFARSQEAALVDPGLLSQFRLTAWEQELVRDDPGFRDASPVSRLDAFFVPGAQETANDPAVGLRFTEYNAETPAGSAYNDVLSELFHGLPVMREFLRRWDLRPLPARHAVLHALLDAWQQWSGRRTPPRVAILDWLDVPTYSEFELFRDYFERQGIECLIADPRQVEYSGGRLIADGAPVDLVYKRVLITELVERGEQGLNHPVIRAVRDRAVAMVNPFRCKLLHKKASLAVLSDERNAELFDGESLDAISAHIPWTRVVEERHTEHQGARVDLVPFVAQNREQLVLKPNDEYGGKGIVLGWEASDEDWTAALRTALTEPYIVQQRVALPSEPYPGWSDGRLHVADRMLDTAPFVAYGSYVDGCLTRLSTAALLNVTAGGGSTVPTFVAEPRP